MNRFEYVGCIEKTLVGQVSIEKVQETVQYYNEYFDVELKKGKTEQEIIELLGDPRLLAKTIITTEQEKNKSGTVLEDEFVEEERKVFHVPFVVTLILVLFLIILIFIIGISIFSILFPYLIIFFVVASIFYLFKKHK